MTLREIEAALAENMLWARMSNDRLWRVRRNGATKTWKREPDRFSIPIKAGLKSCARITEDSEIVEERGGAGRYIIERV